MLPGFTGSLVSAYFAEELLADSFGDEIDRPAAADARSRLLRQRRALADRLGPASGPRQVYDLVTEPMASALGHRLTDVRPASRGGLVLASADGPPPTGPLFVTSGWGDSPASVARDAIRAALAASRTWCVCVNGTAARLLDARRSYARRYSQFDLDAALDDERAFAVLWTLLRSASFLARCASGGPPARQPLIDRIVDASDRNTVGVCRSLREGVLQALGETLASFVRLRGPAALAAAADLAGLHQQSLTIIYRVLFLLFAESRRLVPGLAPRLPRRLLARRRARRWRSARDPATGLWETLQAISRLSHAGCHAGDLRVTPFNGRLFSPSATPLGENVRAGRRTACAGGARALDDSPRRGDARASSTGTSTSSSWVRSTRASSITCRALPAPAGRGAAPAVEQRAACEKATATFYTPRVADDVPGPPDAGAAGRGRTPEADPVLRVVDPAMGSGAFLVAACRFLASVVRVRPVGSGPLPSPSDIDEADRRAFRRRVAQRCLYGVGPQPDGGAARRLSIWLATLAPERPLTFLDHRSGRWRQPRWRVAGRRAPAPAVARPARARAFERGRAAAAVRRGSRSARHFGQFCRHARRSSERPDDSLADVREKERLLATLAGPRSPLARWKAVLDLWCAHACPRGAAPASPGVFARARRSPAHGRSSLAPASRRSARCRRGGDCAPPLPAALEPRVPRGLLRPDGTPLPRPGFDAVVGNPPWDMVRADEDGPAGRADVAGAGRVRLLRFSRDSGVYRAQGDGSLQPLPAVRRARASPRPRRAAASASWFPGAWLADSGCAALRRLLLIDATSIDPVVGFDNADRIFPIHRSVRFLALSATTAGRPAAWRRASASASRRRSIASRRRVAGRRTSRSCCPAPFSSSASPASQPCHSRRSRPRATSRCSTSCSAPACPLIDRMAGAGFGRELNATEDRRHFTTGRIRHARSRGQAHRAVPGPDCRRPAADAVSDARRVLARMPRAHSSRPTARLPGRLEPHQPPHAHCRRRSRAAASPSTPCSASADAPRTRRAALPVRPLQQPRRQLHRALLGQLARDDRDRRPPACPEAGRRFRRVPANRRRSAAELARAAVSVLASRVPTTAGTGGEAVRTARRRNWSRCSASFPLMTGECEDEVGRTYRAIR